MTGDASATVSRPGWLTPWRREFAAIAERESRGTGAALRLPPNGGWG